jgi:glycosyltransferase involved in cell wall biosynthesis
MIFFKNYYYSQDHWFYKLLQNLNKETFYFCISECTKTDFLKNASEQLDKNKMFVTPIATSQIFYPNYDKSNLCKTLLKYNINQKPDDCYIFSLCNLEPRKNLIFTINCFFFFFKKNNIKNMYFYLGGGNFPDFNNQLHAELSSFSEYLNKVIKLGYIDDSDVNLLYSNSLFFFFFSEYEGFGMPPLEAMQAGTPVICSNNSSLPEVVGDAAITITYNDENACIKAFEDFYFNENLRKEYIARGLERAKLFSWEKTFKMMSDIIIDTLKE